MENASELLYMSHLCDSYAYKALFRMHEPMIAAIVCTYIKRYAGCAFCKDDLLQEGRVALLYAIWTYRNDRGAKFSTYASVLVKRKIQRYVIQIVRENDRMKTERSDGMINETSPFYDLLPSDKSMGCPDYYCSYKVGLEKLVRLVGKLGENDRKTLQECMSGYTHKQSAEKLGLSLKSYDARLHRLRRKFKKCLYEDAD